MILGYSLRRANNLFALLAIAILLALAPKAAIAQDGTEAAPAADAVEATAGYTPMAPTAGKGMPVDKGLYFQDQFSPRGHEALWMHNAFLLPVIAAISVLVLFLLLFVMARYNRRTNPVPSKTSHNTAIEIIWTVLPIVILAVIAYPSLKLLQNQFETPPADAVTIKVTGYQWYWGYSYPDNGDFEVVSNMLEDEEADARGEPHHLAVDNRMVVPANTPLRIQTTAADVIHSFAVPSLWFKLDAVPGRLNEKPLLIEEPGVYYGQCSELCGIKHGYMPIAVEALPRDKWEAWVKEQGGTVGGEETATAEAPAADEAAAEAPAA